MVVNKRKLIKFIYDNEDENHMSSHDVTLNIYIPKCREEQWVQYQSATY